MRSKRDQDGVYGYKRYEREGALNGITMEFMATNVK
jgi:hypothetical protein